MIIVFYLYRYNKIPEKNKEQLVKELNCFLAHGYLDMDSFGEPLDEAADALSVLHFTDEQACASFCKKILFSENISDQFLDSLCLGHLFDIEKEYALEYVCENIENMPPSVLNSVMDGLSQYSRTPFRENFSKELIAKIYHRYDTISQDSFYKKMLENDYAFFQEAFPRGNYKN